MIAYYHHTQTLGLGHTFPLGEPWAEGSVLDHALISLPYPFGPDLEILDSDQLHIHFYWILPVSDKECQFKAKNGLDALESVFEDGEIKFWDLSRKSMI